ncbi:MAG: hypothetical protein K2N71_00045, partial [Oscillospiraceae bacterium]|nr:hypothetical protein [Oscillospiraceae bacterium]
MSNNEKKSSLAELLEEYFPGAGQKAEQVLTEMFADYALPDKAQSERISEVTETAAENVPEEIISLDGDEDDDTEDVTDEPFEVPEEVEETEPEKTGEELSTLSQWSEWADETIAANAAASETFDAAETDGVEIDVVETEAADDENAPEEPEEEAAEPETETDETENVSEEDVPEEETAESSESEKITEDEDINEKWLVRFVKGIFP